MEGEAQVIICVYISIIWVVTTQALQGGGQSTVESPLQHRERLSKSLNKEMDFRQS